MKKKKFQSQHRNPHRRNKKKSEDSAELVTMASKKLGKLQINQKARNYNDRAAMSNRVW